jgi:N-acetylglucosamine-6-phosphate deacetylase
MNDWWLTHVDAYCDEQTHLPDAAVHVAGGTIAAIGPTPALSGENVVDGQGLILMPGFIDVHTHGGYGYDFLRQPAQACREFSARTVKEGCTAYLASFVCDSREVLQAALRAYAALPQDPGAQCLGVHMEGPFLNQEYKAVMKPEAIRDPDRSEFQEMLAASGGHLVQMTIAPERPGALELIRYGSAHGVTMMMGHSAASFAQAQAGLEAGAFGITHLYNAMSQHVHRDPGLVTAGFNLEPLVCELIVDGFHIHPEVIRSTYRIVTPRRLALITDSSLMRGLPDGDYRFSGHLVHLSGIHAQVKDTGRIAGSAVTMADCVRNMRQYTGCSLNDLTAMACVNPARIARVADHKGRLAAGYDADMVLLDRQLTVRQTYVAGRRVY